MTDYKLVPVEPTPEMLEAYESASIAPVGPISKNGYKAMLAAAPDVQGEPVGWVWHSYNQTNFTSGSHHKEVLEADGVKLTPVYTAPQPAEQQPTAGDSLTSVPDEVFAAEFAVWWDEHGQFCRSGGGNYERTFAFEAWRHLYPQLMNLQMAAAEQQPALTKYQPCGCVVCTCDHETQCQGCGAHHCGTHPVGQFSKPVYQQHAPDDRAAVRLDEQRREDVADALGFVPGGNYAWTYLLKQIKEIIIAEEKQPEPDVAGLVEALTELCDEIDKHEIHATISNTNISWFKRKARSAIAKARGEK